MAVKQYNFIYLLGAMSVNGEKVVLVPLRSFFLKVSLAKLLVQLTQRLRHAQIPNSPGLACSGTFQERLAKK